MMMAVYVPPPCDVVLSERAAVALAIVFFMLGARGARGVA